MSWDFKVYEPGIYDVVVVCHVGKNENWEVDGRVRANVAGQSVENQLVEYKRVETITMNSKFMDLYSIIGTVKIESPGAHTLTLEVSSDFNGAKPKFRTVMLIPTNNQKEK